MQVKYILSTVQIDESNVIEFDAQLSNDDGSNAAVHSGLTVSVDLLNLLLSDDKTVVAETLAMLRDLNMQQVEGQFYDDETDNLKHCIADC